MKTFLIKLSPLMLVAALMFSTSVQASPAFDREPTSIEFLEGKVHRLSMELEEVRFQLKDRSITKAEKKQLKHHRRMLKRELDYNQNLLAHARFPSRYAYPGTYNYATYRYPVRVRRRPVVCPPSYRRPVVIVNRNNRSRTQGNRTDQRPAPRATPAPRSNRSSSNRIVLPQRKSNTGTVRSTKRVSTQPTKLIKR